MNNITKDIRLSSSILNIKSFIITGFVVFVFNAISNTIPNIFNDEGFNLVIFLRTLYLNLLFIFGIVTVIIFTINISKGVMLLKSFSVKKNRIREYYCTTTIFYTLFMYTVGFLIIGFFIMKFINFDNIFVFGYHLGEISLIHFIKLSLVAFAPVLLISLLLQLFVIVGNRFGLLVNFGVIISFTAGFIYSIIPLGFAIRYGLRINFITATMYLISALLFIISIILQNKIEIKSFSLRNITVGIMLMAIALSLLAFSIYNLVNTFQNDTTWIEMRSEITANSNELDISSLFNEENRATLAEIAKNDDFEEAVINDIHIKKISQSNTDNSSIKGISLVLDNDKDKSDSEYSKKSLDLIVLESEADYYWEASLVNGYSVTYNYNIKTYTGEIVYELNNLNSAHTERIKLPKGIYYQEITVKDDNKTTDKCLDVTTFITY